MSKKITFVTVSRPRSFSMSTNAGDPPVHVVGDYVQVGVRGVWERIVKVDMSSIKYGVDLTDAIDRLQEAAKDLASPRLEIEVGGSVYDAYDTWVEVYLTGQRPATEEEIKWIQWQQDWDADVDRQRHHDYRERAAHEIERYRKEFPDLFKE